MKTKTLFKSINHVNHETIKSWNNTTIKQQSLKESNKKYFLYKWHDEPVRLSLLPSLSFLFPHIFAYYGGVSEEKILLSIKPSNHITI